MLEAAASKFECSVDDIDCFAEQYFMKNNPDTKFSFQEVLNQALRGTGTLSVKGIYFVPKDFQGSGKHRGAAVGSSPGYSYGVSAAEVTVDEDTGVVSVDKIWCAHDCGLAINPLSVEGQIQGGVWMGMAQALSEETGYHEGLHLNPNFLDYNFPTIVESPDIEVKIIEPVDPNGPYGAKEASEGALSSVLAAISSAVKDATGIEITNLPISPDRLLNAIIKRDRKNKALLAKEKST